jgi:hypothetical protein
MDSQPKLVSDVQVCLLYFYYYFFLNRRNGRRKTRVLKLVGLKILVLEKGS